MKSHILAAVAALAVSTLPAAAADSFNLGGAAKGTPSTVAYSFAGAPAVAVFVRGPGDLMYAQVGTDDGASWTPWAPIGTLALKGDPSCVARSASLIDCAAIGPNNAIYWTNYNAKTNAWTGWANLGGAASSNPSVVRTSEGGKSQLRIFVRGPLNHLFMNTLGGGKWSDWQDREGTVGKALSCAAVFNLGAHCYDTTASGVLQLTDITHQTGTDVVVENLGGAVSGRVSAVSAGDIFRVFVLGPSQKLWVKSWSGDWSDWQQTDVDLGSAPGCAMTADGGQAWCASVGGDGTVTMNLIDEAEL